MSNNSTFFAAKKNWSVLKDDLLANYLVPYLEKIKITKKEILIVDCFAGKGKFDDGSLGSPLIILKKVQQSNASQLTKLVFIEKNYAADLSLNVNGKFHNTEVWSGCYEDFIEKIKTEGRGKNVFLYIDPYGVKSLDFSFFSSLDSAGFHSIEILMNFNSNGFLREGCRLLGCECVDDIQSSSFEASNDISSIATWDSIANGDYWRGMLSCREEKELTLHPIEETFCQRYVQELKKLFTFVVDVPIRDKQSAMPHYRMIYATKHYMGVLLMAREMNRAWKKIIESQKKGQEELFESYEIEVVNPFTQIRDFERSDLTTLLLSSIGSSNSNVRDIVLRMIDSCGIAYSPSDITSKLKALEEADRIAVARKKPFTPTNRPSKSWDFEAEDIFVRLK